MAWTLDHGTVNSFLRGLHYPIRRDELVSLARVNNVPGELVDALQHLPRESYDSQQEVMDSLKREGAHVS